MISGEQPTECARIAALEKALRAAESSMRAFAGALLFGGGRRNRRLGDGLMQRAEIARQALHQARREPAQHTSATRP